MGRTGFVIENGGLNSFIGTGQLFPDTEIDLLWRNLATDGKNVIGVIPNTNIVIEPFKRSDYKGFKSGMTNFPDGTHVWGPVETFGEVKEAVIGEEIKIFDAEAIRSSLQELSRQRLSVLRASVRHDQLVPIVSKAEANLNLMDSSLLVTAAVLSVLPRVCRKKEIQVGLSVILVWSFLLVACNETLTSPPPVVKIATGIPTRIYPTETPEPTFVPSSTPLVELAITPSGGAEFVAGSEFDLRNLVRDGRLAFVSCESINSTGYDQIKAILIKSGATNEGIVNLQNTLTAKMISGQSLNICLQDGWAFVPKGPDGNFLWSSLNGKLADRIDRVPGGEWELRSIKTRVGYQTRLSIINGQTWLTELTKDDKNPVPVRYFKPAEGWIDFDFRLHPENDNLLERMDWSGVQNTSLKDGRLHVQGVSGGSLAINRSSEVTYKGDFSFGGKLLGEGAGLAIISEDKKLDVIINRNNGVSRLGIIYRNNGFSSTPVVSLSLPISDQIAAGEIDVDIKFRPGVSEGNIVILVNGKEVKTVTAEGLLKSGKLSLGVTAKPDTEAIVSNLFIKTPNGEPDNAKLVSLIKPTATPTITPWPQFTPAPTFTKTPEPSKGPRLLTQAEGQNLLSNLSVLSECLAPDDRGGKPDTEINGWKYYRKNIASASGTVITYPDGKSFDVAGAKSVIFWVFPQVYNPGSIEIIHITTISPTLVVPNLTSGDYAGITLSPDGKVDKLVVLCFYK